MGAAYRQFRRALEYLTAQKGYQTRELLSLARTYGYSGFRNLAPKTGGPAGGGYGGDIGGAKAPDKEDLAPGSEEIFKGAAKGDVGQTAEGLWKLGKFAKEAFQKPDTPSDVKTKFPPIRFRSTYAPNPTGPEVRSRITSRERGEVAGIELDKPEPFYRQCIDDLIVEYINQLGAGNPTLEQRNIETTLRAVARVGWTGSVSGQQQKLVKKMVDESAAVHPHFLQIWFVFYGLLQANHQDQVTGDAPGCGFGPTGIWEAAESVKKAVKQVGPPRAGQVLEQIREWVVQTWDRHNHRPRAVILEELRGRMHLAPGPKYKGPHALPLGRGIAFDKDSPYQWESGFGAATSKVAAAINPTDRDRRSYSVADQTTENDWRRLNKWLAPLYKKLYSTLSQEAR